MKKRLQILPDAYDEMFEEGGYQGVYDLPVKHCGYYPLYRRVAKEVDKLHNTCILEVGCGTGGLSELILKQGRDYRGFDFSRVAIEKAIQRTQRPDCFWVGDALNRSNYTCQYNTIICTEVLEHLEDDLRMVSLWRKDTLCICSVPNFDSVWHARFFETEAEVRSRYGKAIQIYKIYKLKSPALTNISVRNYVRHIIWNRYRPSRIMKILGLGSFRKIGGWFVFIGRKL